MQTKRQIQQLLEAAGARPNKRFGQHFLIDLNLMQLLIDSANIQNDDIVLEVGCGTGSLTQGLAKHAGYCLAVELSEKIEKIAKNQLANVKNVEILNTDILENKNTISNIVVNIIKSVRKKYTGRLLLVSNLPYSIACPVMLNLVKGPIVADEMHFTVQKELAQRMNASVGNKHYGTLSILLAATGNVKIERILKPTVFWPQPKVDSAMVSFVRKENKARRIKDIELFSELVNLFMQHRRKMIKTCTKLANAKLTEIRNWLDIFESCSVKPASRPEQLPPEDYVSIANLCYKYLTPGK